MLLCVEIGGTKLQLASFDPATGRLVRRVRYQVVPQSGAAGILAQIENALQGELAGIHHEAIGIGFGGPISPGGKVYKSHQIAGWEDFDLTAWFRQRWPLPVATANDCDAAALAEARFGAGRSRRSLFYVTVGTGVGGGWIVEGQRQSTWQPAVAEIGHLRPGLACEQATDTVESVASGWGIVRTVERLLAPPGSPDLPPAVTAPVWDAARRRIRPECQQWFASLAPEQRTAEQVARGAEQGVEVARQALAMATQTLGWAIAQVVTLLAPDCVVIGGGVAKIAPGLFWDPLQDAFAQYVFAPLATATKLLPAQLGDDVVLFGAAALASEAHRNAPA